MVVRNMNPIGPVFARRLGVLLVGVAVGRSWAADVPKFELRRGEVVAFVGGADVTAAQFTGHLEALLAVKYHGLEVRFRNFGWEGDTVFAQPRDVGFPPLKAQLRKAGATMVVFQFGRMESFGGPAAAPTFETACGRMLDECAGSTTRMALVTPPPFENGGGHLPDLTTHNQDLREYAQAIRDLARRRALPVIDLFAELGGVSQREPRLTRDGLQLTPRGQGLVARAFARQAGCEEVANRAGDLGDGGNWSNAAFERVRTATIAKNRLWFEYWRPENWAFLGGDRTEQPSSRDHLDRTIRWFPTEIEKFVPLIGEAEARVNEAAVDAAK